MKKNKFFSTRPWKNIALYRQPVVRRSSAVEQLTVNQLVVGSIPTAGAIFKKINDLEGVFHVEMCLSKCFSVWFFLVIGIVAILNLIC